MIDTLTNLEIFLFSENIETLIIFELKVIEKEKLFIN